MNLAKLVGWYQNNISKYDNNKWEESTEHKIINGFSKKSPNKQKAELIDVDLVRGSSFPKAKAKQTLFTVIRLAALRLLFLPFYSKWWVQQTSSRIHKFLLTLYVLQLFNWGLYLFITTYCEREHIVSMRDIIIPNLLSLLLSMIHSQIVATASTSTSVKSQFSLQAKKRKQRQEMRKSKRVTSHATPHVEKLSKIASDKIVEGQNDLTNCSTFNIQRSNLTNCPNGLRKRNVDWNHVFSPYWINSENNRPKSLESEENLKCDATIKGSERSNIDHGFESFNGNNSSSEELATSSTNQSNGTPQDMDIQMADQYLNFKQNLASSSNVDENDLLSSPINRESIEAFTSPWLGVTSNSESSYSSGCESENERDSSFPTTRTLRPGGTSDRISCTLWHGNEATKVEMSVLDISSVITNKVETMTSSSDYIYIGVLLSILLACVPVMCRISEAALLFASTSTNEFNIQDIPGILLEKASISRVTIIKNAFGETIEEALLLTIGLLLRFSLTFLLFFMLAVAERTFKQRLLYAKLFSHLTSSRRAKKSEVPHFRLSKLRNIKTWLSVRSYLKKRGPQRSVDVIVSATLILSIVFVSFLCAESLNDSVLQHWQYDLEVFFWSCSLGCFILRFMTLGTAINTKYRSVSILITEQINLYLKMEQNQDKKQKLTAANSVLKLAADLLKEIESPFKISGFNINPYLSAAIRVLIVSALSGVCSEMLGFKLKLFKLKEQ